MLKQKLVLGVFTFLSASSVNANISPMTCINQDSEDRPKKIVIAKDADFGWRAEYWHGTVPVVRKFSYDHVERQISQTSVMGVRTMAGPKSMGFYIDSKIDFYTKENSGAGFEERMTYIPQGQGVYRESEDIYTLSGEYVGRHISNYNCTATN